MKVGRNFGQGIKIGNNPSPQESKDNRTARINQKFNSIRQKTQVIKHQANVIVQEERARQNSQRAELFQLFDIVG
ncbi:MAG: hypothetical protein COA79_16660 [Planctomycetota bacterium]|nr:MAG: hypothetical protein COA79_16660 [Planctomycetota bacterium]